MALSQNQGQSFITIELVIFVGMEGEVEVMVWEALQSHHFATILSGCQMTVVKRSVCGNICLS